MVKGWRTNPLWVQHYERKAAERAQKQLDRMRINYEMERSLMNALSCSRGFQRQPLSGSLG